MSATEIEKALQKLGEATPDEIAEFINKNVTAVRNALKSMERWNEAEKIKLTKEEIEDLGLHYNGRYFKWKLIITK
jgi:predicted transcriptional regulator